MPYRVEVTAAAWRQLTKLPSELARRIFPFLVALGSNPRPNGCVKLADRSDSYRIRIGDHRVIYSIDDARRTAVITDVAARDQVYDR